MFGLQFALCVVGQDGQFHRFPISEGAIKRLVAEGAAALWSGEAFGIVQDQVEGATRMRGAR